MKLNLDRLYETHIQLPSTCKWLEYIKTLRFKVSPLISELQDKKLIEHFNFLVHGGGRNNLGVAKDPNDKYFYIHIRLELAEGIECDHKELDNTLEKYDCELPKCDGKFQGRIIKSGTNKENSQFGGLNYEIVDKKIDIPVEFISGEDGWWLLGELSVWVLKMIDVHSVELLTDDDWEIFARNVEQYKHFFENQFSMFSKAVKMEHLLDNTLFLSRYQ